MGKARFSSFFRSTASASALALMWVAGCERTCAQPPGINASPDVTTTTTATPSSPPLPRMTASADAAAPDQPSDAGAEPLRRKPRRRAGPPRPGWPLDPNCKRDECVTSQGEPGFRYTTKTSFAGKPCRPEGQCFNPCPVGMAARGWRPFCNFICRTDEDCAAGECVEGLCETRFAETPADVYEKSTCHLKDGRIGNFDEPTGLCHPLCKLGLEPYGGTDCMKPCESNADCPGGSCIAEHPGEGYCGAPCPQHGCPYPWE